MTVPTVVLLHGQPDTSASFWSLRQELRSHLPEGVRVLAPDRPGYGANPEPATDFAGNVRWLRNWLRRVKAGPVVLVGHSWAGGIAVLAASGEAGPISGLVLLASIGPYCLLRVDPVLAAPVIGEVIAYSALRIGRPLIGRRARALLTGHIATGDVPYAWASGMAMLRRTAWRSFLTEQRALVRELADIERALPDVEVPTHVISASKDTMIPRRTAEALANAIPGATRAEIAGGHDLQLRRPVEVAEQITAFSGGLFDPAARA